MTKREFYKRLEDFEHDPPGRMKIRSRGGWSCDYIKFFGTRPGFAGGPFFIVHSIRHGSYSYTHGTQYKESSKIRGIRLLAKYERWHKEWLAERKEKNHED